MMKNFLVLTLVVLVALVFGGCQTTGTSGGGASNLNSAPANWDGYNAQNRLRIDILVVKNDEKVAEMVKDARKSQKFSKLPFEIFDLVQNGKVERAEGFQQVLVEFTNPNTSISSSFFTYGYGNTNNPVRPMEVIPVSASENQGRFKIEARHGYASLDMPYGYIREPTFVEVSMPSNHTYFPFDGDTVMNSPGELYKLVQYDKQFYLMLIVLD